MADTTLPRSALAAWSRPDAVPQARTAPPPRRRVPGPVLIGDIVATWGGRPLLLTLWDEPEDG